MIVKQKQYENEAMEYARQKFPKHAQWAEYCIAKDAFLMGFQFAKENTETDKIVEVEFNNGENQL